MVKETLYQIRNTDISFIDTRKIGKKDLSREMTAEGDNNGTEY